MTSVEAARLTWADGRGSAEASDLGLRPGVVPRSFEVTSPGSAPRTFSYASAVRDGEGEVVGWRFRSGSCEVTLWND